MIPPKITTVSEISPLYHLYPKYMFFFYSLLQNHSLEVQVNEWVFYDGIPEEQIQIGRKVCGV